MIEVLEDGILWDRDFDMDEVLDAPPEKCEMMKQYMGIEDDYFSAVAPDAMSDAAIEETFRRLESLTQ